MSILSLPSAPRLRQPSRSPFLAGVATLWTGALQAWRQRQAERAMLGLSDEALHDIGVARGEIAEVTRHGRPARR